MESPALVNAKWWVDIWESIEHVAFLGVVLTLAIEFAASHFVKAPRKVIDDARELELVRLNSSAAEAIDRAKKSELELAKFRAPRSLNEAQRKQIADAIRSFSGQEYAVSITPGPDALSFLGLIDSSLRSAGWVRVPPLGTVTIGTEPLAVSVAIVAAPGVRIQISPDRSSPYSPQFKAATTLVSALQAAEVVAETVLSHDVDARPNAIQIMVGYKPTD